MQILLKRYLIFRHSAYINSEFISSITFTDEWIFGMFLMNLFRFCAVNVLSHHECSYRLVKVSMYIFLIAFLYTEKTQTKVWRLHFGELPFSGGWRWPRLFEKILNDCQFWRYKLNFTMYSDSSSHIIVLFLRNWFYFPSKIILLKALATENISCSQFFLLIWLCLIGALHFLSGFINFGASWTKQLSPFWKRAFSLSLWLWSLIIE